MGIIGIGMDLVEVERIGMILDRFGSRFLEKIFSSAERAALPQANLAFRAAARFAAKEAAVKALGTGFTRGIGPADVEVLSLPGGQPFLRFRGAAAAAADRLDVRASHLTLTHSRMIAGATVVLES